MKLPEIHGHNKIRDFKILKEYNDGATMEDIASTFDISLSRVSQIVYRNKHLLIGDKILEKAKRINQLKRLIKKAEGIGSRKDVSDLIAQLRVETEEQQAIVVGGTDIHIHKERIVIFRDVKDDLNGKDITPDVYAREGTDRNLCQQEIQDS